MKPTGAIRSLLDRWQAEAETLRRRGAPAQADALDACVRELEDALGQHELETLTVTEAAQESGYSESQLRRVFKGKLITRASLPRRLEGKRITRGALPRKPAA